MREKGKQEAISGSFSYGYFIGSLKMKDSDIYTDDGKGGKQDGKDMTAGTPGKIIFNFYQCRSLSVIFFNLVFIIWRIQ